MITVVFINAELAIGGAEVVLAKQCEILKKHNVSTHIICTNNFGAIGQKLAKSHSVYNLSKLGKKQKIENIVDIINLVQPNIVYVNNVNIKEAIFLTRCSVEYKLVVQIHGCIENSRAFASKLLETYASSADIIISTHQKTYGMAKKRCNAGHLMILNPIDSVCYDTQIDTTKENIIGYCGRISPEKNLIPLAAIMSAVRETVTDASLIIIGDADEKDPESIEYKHALTDALNGSNIPFAITGFVDNYYEYMNSIKCGVLLSHHEGFSNFLWEASAMGIPVISTNVGSSYMLLRPNDIIKTRNEKELVKGFSERLKKYLLYRDTIGRRVEMRELASRAHQDCYETEFMKIINGRHRS